jgi:tRNA nucleotidyltransferase (CCA-adding enzyme)
MKIPAELQAVLDVLARHGRPLLVGGCVRDSLLGIEPKDFDVEVFGLGWDELARILAPFGPTDVVGRSFGVMKIRVGEAEYDISLPRRESKTAAGHRGFAVAADAMLDERTASARRDFTINALLFDPVTGRVIDHHGGVADLEHRVLRHTSAAFVEDPLRVLRAFQFAARFGLTLAPETAKLCRSMHATFAELPRDRVWGEWQKWAAQSTVPSRGLAVLKETGWLDHFPEVAALDGTPQEPVWHPEGDVFTHTGHCLDALVTFSGWRDADSAQRTILSFAVLAHDFGKPSVTVRAERNGIERWVSPGHDQAGGPLAAAFLERLGSPIDLRAPVQALVEHHHAHQSWPLEGPTDAAVRRLARKLAPATIDQLLLVMEADHRGRPPLISEETTARLSRLREAAQRLALESQAPHPILLGRDLIALGFAPGPRFGEILRTAFEAQLDGAFHDHAAGVAWLRAYLALDSAEK